MTNRIEKYEVADLGDFRDAMERISDQSRFLITARRGDETKFLLVKRGILPTLPEVPEKDAEKASHPPLWPKTGVSRLGRSAARGRRVPS